MARFGSYPLAGPFDGSELVVVEQAGVTVRVPAAALAVGLAVFGFRQDVFANRGFASDFPGGLFFATDDPVPGTGTQYVSDGATWTQIGVNKGELARAQITSNGPSTAGTATSDVTGLVITFTLATARAVELRAECPVQNTAAATIVLTLTDSGNGQLALTRLPTEAVAAGTTQRAILSRRLDLAAGSYSYKIRQAAPTSGVVKVAASASDPAFLGAALL